MTDIVERLRSEADDWSSVGLVAAGKTFAEAADEIERLRSIEEALPEGGEIIIELKQEIERLRAQIIALQLSLDAGPPRKENP